MLTGIKANQRWAAEVHNDRSRRECPGGEFCWPPATRRSQANVVASRPFRYARRHGQAPAADSAATRPGDTQSPADGTSAIAESRSDAIAVSLCCSYSKAAAWSRLLQDDHCASETAGVSERPSCVASQHDLVDDGRCRRGWHSLHRHGDRPWRTILIVHPGGGSSSSWRRVAELLAADFRVVRFDRRPYRIPGAADRGTTIADEVSDVAGSSPQSVSRCCRRALLRAGDRTRSRYRLTSELRGLVLDETPVAVTTPLGARRSRRQSGD